MHTTTTVTSLSFAELRTIEAIYGKAVEIESVTEGALTAIPYLIDHDPASGIYFRVFRTADALTDTGYDVNVARVDDRQTIRLAETNGWFVDEFNSFEHALRYVARHGDRIC